MFRNAQRKVTGSKAILLLFVLFAFTSFTSIATEDLQLTIYTEEFPPYNFEKNGQVTGINATITRLICEEANIECEFQLYPWNRAFASALKNPMSGLISTSRHPERESKFKWVGPLESSTDRACFYKLRRRIDIPMLLNKESIKQYTFPVLRNDVYHSVFSGWGLNEKDHFVLYSNKHEGIKQFANGRLDLMIASPVTLDILLQEANLTIDKVYPVMNVADESFKGNYLALNLKVSDDVINRLQDSLNNVSTQAREDLILSYLKVPKRKFAVDFETRKCL